MVRDDPDEKMGGDVQVRDGFGATSPGTRMVPCWLVWRLYKPKSETKPIQHVAGKTKIVLVRTVPLPGSEMSRYPGRLLPRFGPKSPVSRVRNFPLPRMLASTIAQDIKHFFVIIRYKECQKN